MSDEQMHELSTWLMCLEKASIFPGRLRIFCDERCAYFLSEHERNVSDWQGATGGCLLAAACGAAIVEEKRQGHVVVILPPAALQEANVRVSAQMAVRLSLSILTVIIIGGESLDSDWFITAGWRRAGAGPVIKHVQPPPKQQHVAHPHLTLDHQPVHLPILMPGAIPSWPVDNLSNPLSLMTDWLSWLKVREPRLVVADLTAPWQMLSPHEMVLAALAQYACEGYRVCWRVPTGVSIQKWLEAMYEIGRRGIAIKLFISVNDLPSRPQLAALIGWWVMVPNDVGEAAAMLAHALESEDPVLIALPPAAVTDLEPWPQDKAFILGSGRWLRRGRGPIIVCDYRTSAAAGYAATLLASDDVSVLICSSLLPLPIGDLDQIKLAPVFACGNDLGVGLKSALIDHDRKVTIVDNGTNPQAIVEAVRKYAH